MTKLIHSSLDMDRLDYLLRDSHAAGVPYGQVDINYLLNNLRLSPEGMLGVSQKALPAAEQFLLARYFMHRCVYHHKTTFGLEEACRQLLRRVRDANKFDFPCDGNGVKHIVRTPDLTTFTDAYVDRIVQSAAMEDDGVIGLLARAIQSRVPPKLIKNVAVLRGARDEHHAGATFNLHCKLSLAELAKEFGIEPGQFLLCETKPLGFEARPSLLTSEEARSIAPEEESEDIKVFVDGDAEPKSIVDIPHSIISKCSGYVFQSIRLYVVYEGDDKEKIVAQLKTRVEKWDQGS